MPTKIEWCDESWSPITGCTKVSAGCANCYAERMAKRLRGRFGYPADDPFSVTFHLGRLEQPRHWRKPRRVFVCSMGDLFHDNVSLSVLPDVFGVMTHPDSDHHTYLVLTKRPERMAVFLRNSCIGGSVKYRKNIWLGVSVEDQATADERIPVLLDIPAPVRFVSVEPMLGPVDLSGYLKTNDRLGIDWTICGGESGPGARPMHPLWVRRLRDQCVNAGVPFHFKQWGAWAPDCLCATKRAHLAAPRPKPGGYGCMFRCGKKAAGRKLDGQVWDQYPEVVRV